MNYTRQRMVNMTIKVCSKFNTIEWEADKLPTTEEVQAVYNVLANVVVKDEDMPQRAAKKAQVIQKPQGWGNTYVTPKKPLEPITEPQKATLKKLRIPIPENCSKAQARNLIMEYNKQKGNLDYYSDSSYLTEKDMRQPKQKKQPTVDYNTNYHYTFEELEADAENADWNWES